MTNVEAGKERDNPLGERFERVYEEAGMSELYKSPHKFRHGHAVYCLEKCKNMSDYQAVSRNLMHGNLTVTDKIYAVVEKQERKKMLSGFAPDYTPEVESDLDALISSLSVDDRKKAILKIVDGLIK